MRLGELIWKLIVTGVISALTIFFGVVVVVTRSETGLSDAFLGWLLILVGVVFALIGVGIVFAYIASSRAAAREAKIRVTPRSGPPTAPPPWGMSDVGRPGVMHVERLVGAEDTGRGGVRIVGMPIRHLDVPIVIGFLFIWTAVATLVWMMNAPQH